MRHGKFPKKALDLKKARLKAADFCVYQERSQQEVRNKLYSYGLHQDEAEALLSDLIIEGFINEERFARAYAGGKFRMKGWGRRKIVQGLKKHCISAYCIEKGLGEIDKEDYFNTLARLAEKKYATVKGESEYIIRAKLTRFLLGKGYEEDLIFLVINDLLK